MTHSALLKEDSFERYIAAIRSIWADGNDPLLPFKVKGFMEKLLTSTSPDEPWMAQLIHESKPATELYLDAEYGFVQKAHVSALGNDHSPHDHGPCWVVYGCYRGAKEIMTYRRIDDGKEPGRAILEKKELHRLSPGVAYPYLPGDIHSDKTVEAPAVIFRFLSYDLEKVQRYHYNLEKGTVSIG